MSTIRYISSLLLFSVDTSGLQIINYFSHKHKLQLLLILEDDRVCLTFRHLMLYKIFAPLGPKHIYLIQLNAIRGLCILTLKLYRQKKQCMPLLR